MQPHIGRNSSVLQSGAQRVPNVSKKQRNWSMILEKRRRRHASVELRWNRWTVSGSRESAPQRTGHLTSPPWLRKLRNSCISYGKIRKQNSHAKFSSTESILTGNITTWHGLCTAQDRRALQWVIKTARNITGTHLPSINDIGEVRCLGY